MPPITLPVAEFAPDLPDLLSKQSANVRNVYPRTSQSYGAIGSPSPYSSALTSRCQGAVAFIDSGANVNLFAGDSAKLYHLTTGSTTWSDVSKVGGYTCGSDLQWQYTYFNGDVIATDFTDNPQYFTLGSSTLFADLPGTPPKGKYIGTVKNSFVVFAFTNDGVNGTIPQRVWWSAAGNAKTSGWPTPGSQAAATVQSGATDLLGSSGWIQGIICDLTNADAIVVQEYAVKRMIYAGPPVVFDFLPAENITGTPAPYSLIGANGIGYFLGQDGFYGFDGLEKLPIGLDKIDRTFWGSGLDAVDQSQAFRTVGVSDPVNRMLWWAYPTSAATNGNPNRLLGYNWALNRWCIAEINCETICRLLSIGYTLDQTFTILGYTLDNLPAPLDSRIWTGGKPLFGVFDTNHQLNYMTGPNLAGLVDTQEVQPVPGQRTYVSMTRPLVDGGTPRVTIGKRETLQSAVSFGSAVPINRLGACPQHASGRYIRARITTMAADAWTNISGVQAEGIPVGDM